jgi:hypothetical protein
VEKHREEMRNLTKLVVKGIDRSWTESDIKSCFKDFYASIEQIDLPIDKQDQGKNRGLVFVSVKNEDVARKMVLEFQGKMFRGKTLKAEISAKKGEAVASQKTVGENKDNPKKIETAPQSTGILPTSFLFNNSPENNEPTTDASKKKGKKRKSKKESESDDSDAERQLNALISKDKGKEGNVNADADSETSSDDELYLRKPAYKKSFAKKPVSDSETSSDDEDGKLQRNSQKLQVMSKKSEKNHLQSVQSYSKKYDLSSESDDDDFRKKEIAKERDSSYSNVSKLENIRSKYSLSSESESELEENKVKYPISKSKTRPVYSLSSESDSDESSSRKPSSPSKKKVEFQENPENSRKGVIEKREKPSSTSSKSPFEHNEALISNNSSGSKDHEIQLDSKWAGLFKSVIDSEKSGELFQFEFEGPSDANLNTNDFFGNVPEKRSTEYENTDLDDVINEDSKESESNMYSEESSWFISTSWGRWIDLPLDFKIGRDFYTDLSSEEVLHKLAEDWKESRGVFSRHFKKRSKKYHSISEIHFSENSDNL